MSSISDAQFDYLMDVLTELKGVGKSTAGNIISLKESFEGFSDITEEELMDVSGMTENKTDRVLARINRVDFSEDVRVLQTERIIKEFLATQYQNLSELGLDDLDINVLLVKSLGFTTTEEAVEFYVYQRITRSAVTSWGQGALEELCIVAGSERIPKEDNVDITGKAFDMRKKKEDKDYYIQLKSGPNTMNVGMVNSLNDMIERIEEQHDDAVGMLGMTYGKESQVSGQISENLNEFDDKALVGQELWEFLTEEENYYFDLIARIDRISEGFEEAYDRTFLEAVKDKVDELSEEWKDEYGARGREGMQNFIETYTSD